MTLVKYYKSKIKTLSQTLKEQKPLIKKLMRANQSTGQLQWEALNSQKEVRILYHLYADLRGRDLAKVETNPRTPLKEEEIVAARQRMETFYKASLKPEENYG